MNLELIKQQLHALYIEPNPFRPWAWVLSVSFLLIFPRATRRLGATGFLIVLFAMGIYFGMLSVYKQYTPEQPVVIQKKH